jgi:hypothetical protein
MLYTERYLRNLAIVVALNIGASSVHASESALPRNVQIEDETFKLVQAAIWKMRCAARQFMILSDVRVGLRAGTPKPSQLREIRTDALEIASLGCEERTQYSKITFAQK